MSNRDLISAAVALVGIATAGIVVLMLFAPGENTIQIITMILAMISPILLALMAKMNTETKALVQEVKEQSIATQAQAAETHDVVNHRIDEFKQQVQELARLEVSRQLAATREEGKREGAAEVRTRKP
jgi:uncharacterized membrane protein YgaE (UPF0421/DUF939 family)